MVSPPPAFPAKQCEIHHENSLKTIIAASFPGRRDTSLDFFSSVAPSSLPSCHCDLTTIIKSTFQTETNMKTTINAIFSGRIATSLDFLSSVASPPSRAIGRALPLHSDNYHQVHV